MTKQLLVIGTAVMTTLLALAVLWQFRIVVIFVLLSLVIAAAFRPISRSESKPTLRTRLLLVLQYLVAFVVILLIIYIVGRFLVTDFRQLSESLTDESAWVLPAWLEGGSLQQALSQWLPEPENLFQGLTTQPVVILTAILGFTEGIGVITGGLVIALFLSVYWSINQNHFERLWLSLLPAGQRKQARFIWQTIVHNLGAYTRSEFLQSLLAVLFLGLGYWLLGSPYPALLAVTGAIAWLVPIIGGVLALILPLLLGLLTSPQVSLLTVLYTIIVLVALEAWVEPRLFQLKGNNQVLTFVILLAMADAFGLLGILLAPPISVILQILWRLLVSDRVTPDAIVQVSDLRERQARLQTAIAEMEAPPPLVVSSMERLTELLERAEPVLKDIQLPASPDSRPLPS